MKNKRYFKQLHSNIFFFLLILSCASFLAGCGSAKPISKSDFYLDTIITITLYDSQDEAVLDGCMALCGDYEKLFSKTIETSDISKINRANGAPVIVSDDTAELIRTGISYGKLSDGLFDITIGTLSELWDFKSENPIVPDANKIADALSHVNYKAVHIDGNSVYLEDPNAQIDLGGIAKGYIADRLKDYLLANGITSATINLGGNVLVVGEKPNHDPFFIGIQTPFEDRNTVITPVSITNQSVVSSGPYERYFTTEDGTRYHHILDTKTGYPVENNLYGVTIISDDSVDGDALSTTCFALGLEEGYAFIEALDGVEAIFIDDQYQLIYTDRSME